MDFASFEKALRSSTHLPSNGRDAGAHPNPILRNARLIHESLFSCGS
jgi:hypothetical protein